MIQLMTAIDTADGNAEKPAHALMFRNADTEIGGVMGPRAVCGQTGAHWTAVLVRAGTDAEYAEQVCRACMFLLAGGLHITVDADGQCWPADHATIPAALAATHTRPARAVGRAAVEKPVHAFTERDLDEAAAELHRQQHASAGTAGWFGEGSR